MNELSDNIKIPAYIIDLMDKHEIELEQRRKERAEQEALYWKKYFNEDKVEELSALAGQVLGLAQWVRTAENPSEEEWKMAKELAEALCQKCILILE